MAHGDDPVKLRVGVRDLDVHRAVRGLSADLARDRSRQDDRLEIHARPGPDQAAVMRADGHGRLPSNGGSAWYASRIRCSSAASSGMDAARQAAEHHWPTHRYGWP